MFDDLMREADGGVLFLDEIEALSAAQQARLLAQLEERERSESDGRTGVRVIAAPRVTLEDQVRKGRFREDLFYRLAVLRLRVPPLRERREDIPVLFAQFVREALDRTRRKRFTISAADRRKLLEHDWPGNAGELRNYAYSAVLGLQRVAAASNDAKTGLAARVAAYERSILVEALQQTAGKVSEACRLLKISRQTFYEKVAKHDLHLSTYR